MVLRVFLVCAALAVIAYLPFQFLPRIADDYTQILLGRQYGAIAKWGGLAQDALYRCRATSIVITHLTEQWLTVEPWLLYLTNLLLHLVNTGLVLLLGSWRFIGWRVASGAALFFAVHEGHQEAVVWYAALPELLVFTFILLAFLAAVKQRFVLAYACFVLALLSKESGVAFVPLLALVCWIDGMPLRRLALLLVPFAATAAAYTFAIFGARTGHLHFNDGTFSLTPAFVTVVIVSAARLLWIWGVIAGGILLWKRQHGRVVLFALAWMGITMLPYAFLTYMPRMPSRHVYLASVGLSLLVGAALVALSDAGWRKPAMAAAVGLIVAHNAGYLWYKKYPQYVRRAEPTEAIIRYGKAREGVILVRCFPYGEAGAFDALEVGAGKSRRMLRWDPKGTEGYCDPSMP